MSTRRRRRGRRQFAATPTPERNIKVLADGDGRVGTTDNAIGLNDNVFVRVQCPAIGPVTLVVTATQGGSAKSVTVKCRGPIDTVTAIVALGGGTPALRAASANILTSSADVVGNGTGTIVATAKDSEGNSLKGKTFIATTTGGFSEHVRRHAAGRAQFGDDNQGRYRHEER